MTSRGSTALIYNSYNKPTRMTDGALRTEFRYGPDRSRFYRVDKNNAITRQTYYLNGGNYEEVFDVASSTTKYKHQLGNGIQFVLTKGPDLVMDYIDYQFMHKDHLGSVDVITDMSGTAIEQMAFAPFGTRAQTHADDLTLSDDLNAATLATTTDGFTGHEMLDDFGLIHMNGRVYDPQIGRFLSADPFVQAPENSQSFNRYSYVMNNPLSLVDPSGYVGVATEPLIGNGLNDFNTQFSQQIDNQQLFNHISQAGVHDAHLNDQIGRAANGIGSNNRNTGSGVSNGSMNKTQNRSSQSPSFAQKGGFSLPSLPQSFVNFSAGLGDVLLLGFGDDIRAGLDIGSVDMSSGAYSNGEWAGIGASLITGGIAGLKAAGSRVYGNVFSHWVPSRAKNWAGGLFSGSFGKWFLKTGNKLNGNYVSRMRHYKHDPKYYGHMKGDGILRRTQWGARYPAWLQQLDRIPNVYKGIGLGGAYGGLGASASGN